MHWTSTEIATQGAVHLGNCIAQSHWHPDAQFLKGPSSWLLPVLIDYANTLAKGCVASDGATLCEVRERLRIVLPIAVRRAEAVVAGWWR